MNYLTVLNRLLAALIIFVLFSCESDKDGGGITGPPASSKTKIRVIHTSYDAPAVDIAVDGTIAISNLSYGKSSGYAELESGVHNIKVTPNGQSSPIVIEANPNLLANKEYTVYAVNSLSLIEPIISNDDRTVNPQKAKVRFLHASPDAPAVDIKLNSGSGASVFSNASFKEITEYVEVNESSYTFVVTPTNSSSEVVVFVPIMLNKGKVYTIIAHGTLTNSQYPFAVRAFIDNDSGNQFADLSKAQANIMAIHASPDAPGVDILLDGTIVNPSAALEFPQNSGYLAVNAGTRNVKVNVTGSATTVIEENLTLEANKSYSVFAINPVASITSLLLEDNLTPPIAGKAHARFIHLSPDAPAVDITFTDGTKVFDNSSFKQYSNFTPLNSGSYDLQVRAAGTTTVVLSLPTIQLQDGKVYTIFARGLLNGQGAQELGAEIIVHN